ncbi:MAG: hypothetical protein J6I85_07130 [Clostridia bacterium]|nr:hypothetical protein [Clostridia bacterium]
MADDRNERKRKLEELRKKKKQLQDMVKDKQLSDPAKESSSKRVNTESTIPDSPSPSNPISTNPSFTSTHTKTNSLLADSSKNKRLLEIHRKKVNEALRTSKSEHYLQGIHPDVKTEETQYVLPEEFEEKRKEEELLKQQMEQNKKATKFARRASMSGVKEVQKKMNLVQFGKQKIKEAMKKIAEKNLFYSKTENQIKAYCDNNFNILNEALYSNDIYDICNSYYNEEETDVNISKKTLAKHVCDLYDDQCNGRIVTALDWSPIQRELFLSAFSGTEDFNQQSGLIQLWSLLNRKTPEYVINYQTELTSAIFYKDNPNLVIGGSVTGQIMFWDIKTGRAVPEQKSPLGVGNDNSSHCYPIHCLTIVGKDNNLVSISTDGVMCEWSLNNLSSPINRYVLNPNDIYEQDKDGLNEIGPLCIGACQSNNSFIIGCDENDIYNIKLEEKRYNVIDTYRGSKGPIFCVSPHPPSPDEGSSFSDLFLSCGADWTTKLWSTSQSEEPLLTFNQSKDYVYSAKWHPINPSIFATGDGSGYIDLWDLNRDREIPTFRYDLKTAVNRLAWSHDGKKLAAGDINGHIAIFQSEKDVVNVKIEDVNKFSDNIKAIKENCKLELEKKRKKEMK